MSGQCAVPEEAVKQVDMFLPQCLLPGEIGDFSCNLLNSIIISSLLTTGGPRGRLVIVAIWKSRRSICFNNSTAICHLPLSLAGFCQNRY